MDYDIEVIDVVNMKRPRVTLAEVRLLDKNRKILIGQTIYSNSQEEFKILGIALGIRNKNNTLTLSINDPKHLIQNGTFWRLK